MLCCAGFLLFFFGLLTEGKKMDMMTLNGINDIFKQGSENILTHITYCDKVIRESYVITVTKRAIEKWIHLYYLS